MQEIREICKELAEFLQEYSWIFDFSNVQVFSKVDEWPLEWKKFIYECEVHNLKKIFKEDFSKCPEFVKNFVTKRNQIAKKFEKNHVKPLNEKLLLDFLSAISVKEQLNQTKKGMSAKKQHEVFRFGDVIKCYCKDFEQIVDVGSGAGHLERYLIAVLGFKTEQLVCIESSECHVESASKKAKFKKELIPRTIKERIDESNFQKIDNQLKCKGKKSLIGLHSCGDLTNTMMSWFKTSGFESLLVVSCCYHKMTSFPVSETLKGFINEDLKSHFALRLACQDEFEKWIEQDEIEHKNHSDNFGRRALQENVVKEAGGSLEKQNRHGIRKNTKDKEEYMKDFQKAYKVRNVDEEIVKLKVDEKWTENFRWLEILTGLQSFLQILLEYLVMSDKLLYLFESGFEPYLMEIFCKSLSPRNLLLICKK